MSDDIDKKARAEHAERLLGDPLLNEAWAELERALVDKIVEAPARDDDGRTRCAYGIQVGRKVRQHLHKIIQEGKSAAIRAANDIAADQKRRWPF